MRPLGLSKGIRLCKKSLCEVNKNNVLDCKQMIAAMCTVRYLQQCRAFRLKII